MLRYNARILSFFLAVIMALTFVMPASAAVPEAPFDLEDAWVLSDAAGGNEGVPETNAGSTTVPDEAAEPETGQETADTTANTLGISGDLSDAELLALFEQWASGLRLAGSNPMTRSAAGDTGTVTHTSIPVGPYNVTVPGVGNAYGSVMLRMKINGQDAFCVQIWRLVGSGTYVAGTTGSGNAATAQYVANFEASAKTNADYVAAQVLIWESLYGDIGLYSQIIQGTSYQSNYNALKNGTATGSGLLFWVSGANDQDIVTTKTDVPETPETPDEPDNPNEPPTETTTTTSTRTEVRTNTEYEYSDAIGQITVCKRDEQGKSLDGAIFNIHIQFANGQTGGDSAFEVYNARLVLGQSA